MSSSSLHDQDPAAAVPSSLPPILPLLSSHLVVAVVALVVIGGATRVMEAGLACPDWPLCYGALLPGRQMNLQVFLEWFHRLDALLVGLALLALQLISLRWAARLPRWLPRLTAVCLLLVILQGALGALTVLQLLAAGTVTAHLTTALVLLLALSALHQRLVHLPPARAPIWWILLCLLAAGLLLIQCVLGGSMASRWAAGLCLHAGDGCGWLLAHRLAAYPAAIALLLLALLTPLSGAAAPALVPMAAPAGPLVLLQLLLGSATLRHQLSVPALTIAHQLVAALLVALLGALLGRCAAAAAILPPSRSEVVHG